MWRPIEKGGRGAVLHWSLGGVLISLSLASEPVDGLYPLSLRRMASATPDQQLTFQPQSITVLWPVPNYTAW